MTHGRTYNCISGRILFCALAWVCCLQALGVNYIVSLENNGTTMQYTHISIKQPTDQGIFYGQNMGALYPGQTGVWYFDRPITTQFRVYFGPNSSAPWDVWAFHESGQQTVTGGSTANLGTWYVNYSPPAPEYRFDAYVQNGTHAPQFYWVGKPDASLVLWEGVIQPGGQQYISLVDQEGPFAVYARNHVGDFPPLSVTIGADNTLFWRPMDTGLFTPETILHTYAQSVPTNNWLLPWDAPPPDATNNEAPLSEGTYKTGVESLYSQNRDIGNNLLVTLRDLREQLGGNQLATAATNLGQSGNQLNLAASNLAGVANQMATNGDVVSAVNRLNSSNQSGFNALIAQLQKTNAAGDKFTTNELQEALNHYHSVAGTAMATASNQFGTIKDTISGMTNGVGGYASDTNFWRLSFPVGARVYSINLNPMHSPKIQRLATWVKYAISWLSAAALLYFIVEECQKAAWHQGAYSQVFAPNLTKKSWLVSLIDKVTGGVGGLVVATGGHAVIFLVVAGLLSALAIIAVTYLFTFGLDSPGPSPFNASNGAVAGDSSLLQAMWLVDQFIDVSVLVLHWTYAGAFRVVLIVHALAVQAGMKAIPANMSAWVILALTVGSANAFDVRFHNGTAADLVIGAGAQSPEIHVPSGEAVRVADWIGPDLVVFVASDLSNSVESIDLTTLGAITDEDRITVIRGLAESRVTVEPAVMWAFELGCQVGVGGVTVMALVYLGRLLRPSAPGAVE